MKRKPQKTLIKEWFAEGKELTRISSLNFLGVAELSSRIGELVQTGYEIWGYWKEENHKRFKVYFTKSIPEFEQLKKSKEAKQIEYVGNKDN